MMMYFVKLHELLCILCCLISFLGTFANLEVNQSPKIAIIGAGIGGTSCAHFLNQLFNGEVKIDLYEANKVGGRLRLEEVDGAYFEAGGAIVHPKNKYMKDFVQDFGLHSNDALSDGMIGLYDGKEFVFIESSWEYLTLLKMMWHYGIDMFRLHSYVTSMLDHFDKIYGLQDKGETFVTVRELLNAMDPEFSKYLTKSVNEGFKRDNDYNKRLVDELVYATIRVNYGQNNKIHQFVGSVSVAGAMSGLWSVKGGNYQVAEQLAKYSNAKLIMKRVNSVALMEGTKQFNVSSSDGSDQYDLVVIATPLTSDARSPIEFNNFPSKIFVPGSYHRTICTLVLGVISNNFFGYDDVEKVPTNIFAIEDSLFYNSISLLKSNGDKSVYKVFSQTVLTNEQLSLLFKLVHKVKMIDWLAYPQYSTEPRNDSFILHERLYYVNAIEWAASAMEMSVIGGRNAAILAYNHLKQPGAKEVKPSLVKGEL